MFPRQGSGRSRLASSSRPATPKRSVTGQGRPKLISAEWIRFLSCASVLDQVEAEASQLALSPHPRIGQPDRRHQVALGEHGQDPGVDPVGLHRQRRQPLHLLGVGDLHLPAVALEGVVDEAGAGHRLDHRPDGLPVCLDSLERGSSGRRSQGRR